VNKIDVNNSCCIDFLEVPLLGKDRQPIYSQQFSIWGRRRGDVSLQAANHYRVGVEVCDAIAPAGFLASSLIHFYGWRFQFQCYFCMLFT